MIKKKVTIEEKTVDVYDVFKVEIRVMVHGIKTVFILLSLIN